MASSIKKTTEDDQRLLSASSRSKKTKKEASKQEKTEEAEPKKQEVICPSCGNPLDKLDLPGYGRCFAHRNKRMCDKVFRNFKELRAFEEELKADATIEENIPVEDNSKTAADILPTIEKHDQNPEITHDITLEDYEEAGRDIFKLIKPEAAKCDVSPQPDIPLEKIEVKRLRKRGEKMTIKRATVKDGQVTKITNDGMTTFLGAEDQDGRTVLLSTIGMTAAGEVYLTNFNTNQKIAIDIKKAKSKDGFSGDSR